MAGKVPAGTFNTRIGLDTDQPEKTMKQLRTEVSALTSEWRAQSAQLKSAGDSLSAANVKYEGLTASVKHQEEYISRLRAEQSKLDTSTNRGAEDFAKLEKQIGTASTRLQSMTSQQQRAKESVDFYKSGLADAEHELSRISETSRSYVTRLQAEGKQTEANKREASDLGDQLSKMERIYRLQSNELNKIADASGKSSEAYAKQAIRVNETATKMAQAKTRMGELNDAISKANPTVFTRLRTAVAGTNKEAEKTPGLFKKIVTGGLVTNAITAGWTALTGTLKETLKSGLELNEAGETLKNTWSAMGKSANDIQILSDQMSYLRAKTGDSAGEVNVLQRTLDTLTSGNTQKTVMLTQGLAAVGTASHLSGQQTDGLAKALTRVIASGDLTTGSLARLEKAAPTLGAQLSKAAGVSQASFNKMVADGKISSADFMNLLSKVGTTSNDVFDRFGKTSEGALAQLSGGWLSIKAKMAAPLLDVKNSGMSSLASILTSKVVQDAATTLGTGIAKIANYGEQLLEYISKHKTDVTGIATDLWDIAKIAGGEVWSIFKGIISDVAGFLGVGGKNAKDMKDPLGTIHDILDKIVANKEGIRDAVKIVLSLFAAKKALTFAGSIVRVMSVLKDLTSAGIISRVSSLVSKLAQVGTGTSAVANAVGNLNVPTSGVATTVASTTSRAGSSLAKVGNTAGVLAGAGAVFDVGGSIATALVSNSTTAKVKAASKSTGAVIGGGIGAALGSIIPGAGTVAGAGIGAAIGDALGSTKTAQKWANSIHDTIKKATAGIKISTPKISTDDKALGTQFEKYAKALSKKMVVSISTDPKSLAKASASVSSTYTKMQKSVDSYYKKKEASAAADLKKLVVNGSMTQKQADAQMAKLKKTDAAEAKSKKSAYADMQKSATSYYAQAIKIANGNTTKLQAIAKKDGKNSAAYEKEKNKELLAAYKSYAAIYVKQEMSSNSKITSTVQKGAQQQTKLLQKLTKDKGKLSITQLNNTAKNAKAEYNAAVKPAQQARDQIIAAASSKYKSTVATAKKEYKDNGTISKAQYNDIVAKAKAQRDDVVTAAGDQYKKTTKHASNQYGSVKSAIEKQKATAIANQQAQMSGVTGYASSQSKAVVGHATTQANSSMKAGHAQASGTHSIFSGLGTWFNKFLKMLGGSQVSISKASYGYTQVGGLAYANGGSVIGSSKALVGEAGPELRYSPYSSTVDLLGAHGAEFASVKSGEYILNADDTAKLLAGNYGKTLPGYAAGTSTLASFLAKVKSGASSIFDKVSDAASSAFDAITHPLDTLKKLADGIFNISSVSGVGSAQRSISGDMRDKSVSTVANAFAKLRKAFDDGNDSSSAAEPKGSGVQRWKPDVIKALKKNGFDATAGQVAAWLRVIARESNGNPRAQNNWDSNAKKGIPSKGLVQTIEPTFNAFKFPGHGNIFNGYDDLLAGINYMKHIYGTGNSAFARVSGSEGYANGGFASVPSIFGEAGLEAAIPMSSLKASRGYEMLGKTAAAMAARDHMTSDGSSDLGDKLDKLIVLMTAMVNGGGGQPGQTGFGVYIDGQELAHSIVKPLQNETNRAKRLNARAKGATTW
ncbi:MAG: tape measure protein [Lactobacillus sp.]|jgi:tape measure domain-containing protein|nr:tape measure protein [Lactobacillus sp.]MCI2032057.1 tape measure protein [Lactobacillus sp.]